MYLFIKRFFDIFISVIGIVLLIPITIIVKLLYIITGDFHRIFYSQTRVGKNGKLFKLYKFRTMVPDADKILKKLIKSPEYKAEWEKFHKLENDPRITKIGRILRKLSIDEIPQFVNIFLGPLSLIGPRPLVPGEIEEYGGNKLVYESVKPGLTGWWAVNGRSGKDTDDRLALEYYYIKHCGLLLDAKIFFMTIAAVFKRDGAH